VPREAHPTKHKDARHYAKIPRHLYLCGRPID
jgi:hypothetical protein